MLVVVVVGDQAVRGIEARGAEAKADAGTPIYDPRFDPIQASPAPVPGPDMARSTWLALK